MGTRRKRSQRGCVIRGEASTATKHQRVIAWTSQIASSLLLLFSLVLASGCVPPRPGGGGLGSQPGTGSLPGPRSQIGTLRIIHGNVMLNRAPAVDGAPVFSGDEVATGSGSTAKVDLPGYGWIQLDENTDPILERIVQGSCRLLVRVLQLGQVWGTGTGLCEEDPNGVALALNSSANLMVLRGRSVITAVEGTVTVLRPTRIVLTRGQQVEVVSRKMGRVVTLPEPQLRAVYAWMGKYQTIR